MMRKETMRRGNETSIVKVFVGLGFYGGVGPEDNDTSYNAGYGSGGISWLTQTSINQSSLYENNAPWNPTLRMKQLDRSFRL